jgi:hypothetical protein
MVSGSPLDLQFVQMLDYVRELNSFGTRPGQKLAAQLRDAAPALLTIDSRLLVRQKGSSALLGSEHFPDFQFSIGADHGIGIDGQVDRQLADCRELIARTQRSGSDSAQHLIDNLAVGGDSAVLVQGELNSSIIVF